MITYDDKSTWDKVENTKDHLISIAFYEGVQT